MNAKCVDCGAEFERSKYSSPATCQRCAKCQRARTLEKMRTWQGPVEREERPVEDHRPQYKSIVLVVDPTGDFPNGASFAASDISPKSTIKHRVQVWDCWTPGMVFEDSETKKRYRVVGSMLHEVNQ